MVVSTTPWVRHGKIWIRETDSASLLSRQPPTSFLAKAGILWSVNPLAGCALGCADCYVPDLPAVKFRRDVLPDGQALKAATSWGTWVEVRRRAPALLRAALRTRNRMTARDRWCAWMN